LSLTHSTQCRRSQKADTAIAGAAQQVAAVTNAAQNNTPEVASNVGITTISGPREWITLTLNQDIKQFGVQNGAVTPKQNPGKAYLGANWFPFGDALHDDNGWKGFGVHGGILVDSSFTQIRNNYFMGISYQLPDWSPLYPGWAPVLKPLSSLVVTTASLWNADAVAPDGAGHTRQSWQVLVGFDLVKGVGLLLNPK
jgi:hypothetical protein